jgi:hypothetical protein
MLGELGADASFGMDDEMAEICHRSLAKGMNMDCVARWDEWGGTYSPGASTRAHPSSC